MGISNYLNCFEDGHMVLGNKILVLENQICHKLLQGSDGSGGLLLGPTRRDFWLHEEKQVQRWIAGPPLTWIRHCKAFHFDDQGLLSFRFLSTRNRRERCI